MITRILQRMQRYRAIPLDIGGKRLRALLADTPTKRMIGLMHREGLARGECMLFVFGTESRQGIWMRNMRFPIDVAWLDRGKRVVDFVEGIRPSKGMDFKTYLPGRSAAYIVELNPGFIRANGVRRGSAARFKI